MLRSVVLWSNLFFFLKLALKILQIHRREMTIFPIAKISFKLNFSPPKSVLANSLWSLHEYFDYSLNGDIIIKAIEPENNWSKQDIAVKVTNNNEVLLFCFQPQGIMYLIWQVHICTLNLPTPTPTPQFPFYKFIMNSLWKQ